jgi:hypothetical protein
MGKLIENTTTAWDRGNLLEKLKEIFIYIKNMDDNEMEQFIRKFSDELKDKQNNEKWLISVMSLLKGVILC